ncbi:hypothetical protein L2E82_32274 [Cichorium intybus]|uniref:Uncharacterized protein n=1 Tax=Cichorium intybus TaxID=13427 RepID=A0ACB9BH41_CICIN|nr:hypothetical protein L2E82_32274 [Cichorium intybus]
MDCTEIEQRWRGSTSSEKQKRMHTGDKKQARRWRKGRGLAGGKRQEVTQYFHNIMQLTTKIENTNYSYKYINVHKIILSPSSLYKSPIIPPTNVASKPLLVN